MQKNIYDQRLYPSIYDRHERSPLSYTPKESKEKERTNRSPRFQTGHGNDNRFDYRTRKTINNLSPSPIQGFMEENSQNRFSFSPKLLDISQQNNHSHHALQYQQQQYLPSNLKTSGTPIKNSSIQNSDLQGSKAYLQAMKALQGKIKILEQLLGDKQIVLDKNNNDQDTIILNLQTEIEKLHSSFDQEKKINQDLTQKLKSEREQKEDIEIQYNKKIQKYEIENKDFKLFYDSFTRDLDSQKKIIFQSEKEKEQAFQKQQEYIFNINEKERQILLLQKENEDLKNNNQELNENKQKVLINYNQLDDQYFTLKQETTNERENYEKSTREIFQDLQNRNQEQQFQIELIMTEKINIVRELDILKQLQTENDQLFEQQSLRIQELTSENIILLEKISYLENEVEQQKLYGDAQKDMNKKLLNSLLIRQENQNLDDINSQNKQFLNHNYQNIKSSVSSPQPLNNDFKLNLTHNYSNNNDHNFYNPQFQSPQHDYNNRRNSPFFNQPQNNGINTHQQMQQQQQFPDPQQYQQNIQNNNNRIPSKSVQYADQLDYNNIDYFQPSSSDLERKTKDNLKRFLNNSGSLYVRGVSTNNQNYHNNSVPNTNVKTINKYNNDLDKNYNNHQIVHNNNNSLASTKINVPDHHQRATSNKLNNDYFEQNNKAQQFHQKNISNISNLSQFQNVNSTYQSQVQNIQNDDQKQKNVQIDILDLERDLLDLNLEYQRLADLIKQNANDPQQMNQLKQQMVQVSDQIKQKTEQLYSLKRKQEEIIIIEKYSNKLQD